MMNYNWIQKIWKWADENDIDDLGWTEPGYHVTGGWSGLPRNKDKLLSLTELNLSNCGKPTYLPKEIGFLTILSELDVSFLELTSIPNEIGKLTNLESFACVGNRLVELPDGLCELKNLTELYVQRNNLQILPGDIGNLVKLQILDIESNDSLTRLPESIINLVNLQKLRNGTHNIKLNKTQKQWLDVLIFRGCEVQFPQLMRKKLFF